MFGCATLTIHEPDADRPDVSHTPQNGTTAPDIDQLVVIKEGISWPALLFSPFLWLIYHRMWQELLIFTGVFAGLHIVLWGFGITNEALLSLTISGLYLLFALEANDLRRRRLRARGYHEYGPFTGRNRNDAMMNYFISRTV